MLTCFKMTVTKKLLRETAEKLKVKDDGKRKIKKLAVVSTKGAQCNINENRILLQGISKTVRLKSVCKNFRKFLESMNCTIQESLKGTSVNSITILSARLRRENKESNSANNESARRISDLFIKTMDVIKNADKDQISVLQEPLFPLQSYAQTRRKYMRSLDADEKMKLWDELIFIRMKQFEKIRNSLSEAMSSFLKKLFDSTTVDQKVMFVVNIQYN